MAQQYNLTDSDSSNSEAQFEVGRLFEVRQIKRIQQRSRRTKLLISLKLCRENYDYNIIYMYMYNNMIPVIKKYLFKKNTMMNQFAS